MNEFATFIGKRRKNLGPSQLQVAKRAAVDPSRLSRWESGKALPSRELAVSLCRALLMEMGSARSLLATLGYQLTAKEVDEWYVHVRDHEEAYKKSGRLEHVVPEQAFAVGSYVAPAAVIAGGEGHAFGLGDIVVDVDQDTTYADVAELGHEFDEVWTRLAPGSTSTSPLDDEPVVILKEASISAGRLYLLLSHMPWRVFAVVRQPSPLPLVVEQYLRANNLTRESFAPLGSGFCLICANEERLAGTKVIFKRRSPYVFTHRGCIDNAVSGYLRVGRFPLLDITRTRDSLGAPAMVCPFTTAYYECADEAGFFPSPNQIVIYGAARNLETGMPHLFGSITTDMTYEQVLALKAPDGPEGAPAEQRPWPDRDKAEELAKAQKRTVRWPEDFRPELAPALIDWTGWAKGAEAVALHALMATFGRDAIETAFRHPNG